MADLDDLARGVGVERADAAEVLGGGNEFAGSGEEGQLPEDLDLDVVLDDVVGVGLGGIAGAEAVVGEDGIALGQSVVEVGVCGRIDLDIPVSATVYD